MSQDAKLDPKDLPKAAERAETIARLRGKALEAKQRGEWISAMLFASDALMLQPNERQALDLVDDIVEASGDPLSVVPVATGAVHVATAAVRARILMTQQRLEEALELLGQIIDVVPGIAYLEWAQRWLQPAIIQRLGLGKLIELILKPAISLSVGVGVPARPTDPRLPNVAAAAAIFAAVREQFPDEAFLYWAEATCRRRLGDPNATIAVATQGVQRFNNDARLRCALMLAYRDAKRADESLQQARAAMQIDPEDNAPLHDAAWAFIETDRLQEALNLFQELLQREPDYPGADAVMHYLNCRVHNSAQDRDALLRLRETRFWDDTVVDLAAKLDPVELYYNYLPGPADATAAGARHVIRELGAVFRCCGANAQIGYTLHSNYVESPSVGLALDVAIRSMGGRGADMQVVADDVQTPDPRVDKAGVSYRLWQYEGSTPKKVYPAADANVQRAIAQLASQLYRFDVWEPAARQLAQHYNAQWVHALLAVLTDPPLPPQDSDFGGLIWTYRCQIATALVISHLDPWQDSAVGRSAIYSLIYGPTDWISAAGLIALGFRAKADPAIRAEAEQVFAWMRTQVPDKGFCAWELPLIGIWLGVGPHQPAVEADLKAWQEEYETTSQFKGAARLPERRYGGLTLAEYAEFCSERDHILSAQGAVGTAVGVALGGAPPPQLVQLCQRFGVPLDPGQNAAYPYIAEWQEAISDNPQLSQEFADLQRNVQLQKQGVSGEEVAALDQIREGNMDMHLRMAQQQQAQRAMNEGDGGDPDPVVFPGQPVARLSDYVGILKGMQTGDMMGALGRYGLDMMSYGSVATAWGAKLAADPMLNEKFSRMMSG